MLDASCYPATGSRVHFSVMSFTHEYGEREVRSTRKDRDRHDTHTVRLQSNQSVLNTVNCGDNWSVKSILI